MTLERWAARSAACIAAVVTTLLTLAAPAHAIRIATWNLIDYPNTSLALRQPLIRTVMANYGADVLVVQELKSDAGRESLLTNVLNVVQPGQWTSGAYVLSTETAIFYKPSVVTLVGQAAVGYSGVRDGLVGNLQPVGYGSGARFRIYSVHLKAGSAAADVSQRATEASNLRNVLNTIPANTPFILGGDFNIYSADEIAYVRLTESQADNDGRGDDPLNMPGNWNSNANYRCYHTQCPCISCLAGYSGGGMDDRFDIWFTSLNVQDGEGVDLVPGSYTAYGNDCNHFNDNINGGGTNSAVPIAVADALHDASDHIPVLITLQVPAKISAAPVLDFGSAIVGGTAQRTLSITNPAVPPADELTYTFTAPAGFGAPAGTFNVNPGSHLDQTITMSSATPGALAGTLVVNCDDPDTSSKTVLVSGRVLRHASPSFDSLGVIPSTAIDFGYHEPGDFGDLEVRVHNQGYNSLQALLSLDNVAITGPAASRFSIAGGFSSGLLGAVGRTFDIHFDDSAAPLDSIYLATLTFQSSDEPLPGATPSPPLSVDLRATLVANPSGAPPHANPTALRFYAPRPNPVVSETWLGFDLPQAASVSLEVFDLTGRRVASLVSGTQDAGHHEVRWSATEEGTTRLPGGLYFARFTTPGFMRTHRIALLP